MRRLIYSALVLFILLTLTTGLLYPLLVTGLANLLFPAASRGSLLERKGIIIGSALIAQRVKDPAYFWPRPSATDFSTMPSGASNRGPLSSALQAQIAERRREWTRTTGNESAIPSEMLTASASGLDPDISPGAALAQLDRIARARRWKPGQYKAAIELIETQTKKPSFGFIGSSRINILQLNLALNDI